VPEMAPLKVAVLFPPPVKLTAARLPPKALVETPRAMLPSTTRLLFAPPPPTTRLCGH